MAFDDDDIIDEAVVEIRPEVVGFDKLRAKIAALTKNLEATVKVRVVADRTGFGRSITEAVRAQQALKNQPTYKIALKADARGFGKSVREAVKKAGGAKITIGGGGGGDRDGGEGGSRSSAAVIRAVEGSARKIHEGINRALLKNLEQNFLLPREQSRLTDQVKRVLPGQETARAAEQAQIAARIGRQKADEAYVNFRAKILNDLTKIERDYAGDEVRIREETNRQIAAIERLASRQRITLLEQEDKIARDSARRAAEAERDALARANQRKAAFRDLNKLSQARIIDFGGRGIRPMNLLYASLAALSPLLVSVASSATLASTSIAALGAAGIGAATGITGLVLAFGGVRDALKLRETVNKQQLKQQAEERDNTGAILDAQDRLIDSRERLRRSMRDEAEAQTGINEARREAARDLENLRRKVEDLRNQERSDRLSVAEAKAERDATVRNFFTSALERQRAQQDVADAENRLANTSLERRQTRQDYAIALPKGVENSDVVRDAKQALRDAIADRQRAQRELADSLRDLAAARNGTVAGGVAATQAMSQLEEQLRKMSPAAREMYYWFDRNEEALESLRRGIEQRVLPGFTQFLRDVTDRSRGASALDLFADAAGRLGSKFSDLARDAGKIVKQEWFKDSFAEIINNNATAMDSLRRATTTLVKPFMQIFASSSPLLERFANYLEWAAGRFALFIDQADRSGRLDQWFKRAGDELARWGKLGGEILRFFKGIFTATMPSGTTLLDRLTGLFKGLADWSNSPQGQKSVRDFFDRIANLPFAKIGQFAASLTALFLAVHTTRWALANPLFGFFGLLLASNPQGALTLVSALTAFLTKGLQVLVDNPALGATVLGIFAAAKGAKALKIAMDIPGITSLKNWITSKFKPLEKLFGGGATTGTMTVTAGVVNIIGKAGGVGPGGTPIPVGGPDGKNAKTGKWSKIGNVGKKALPVLGALISWPVVAVGVGTGVVFEMAGKPFEWDPVADAKSWWKSFENTLREEAQGATWDEIKGLFGKDKPKQRKTGGGSFAPTGSGTRLADHLRSIMQTSIGAEKFAYDTFVGWRNTPGAKRDKAFQDYVKARKKAVADYAAYVRSTQGPVAAEKVLQAENARSAETVRKFGVQMGLSKEEVKKYSTQITVVPKVAETKVNAPGLSDAITGFNILKTRIDPVTGSKTITVSVNGEETVFATLREALIFQRSLQSGLDLKHAEQAIRRDEEATRKRLYGHAATGGPIGRITGPGTRTSDSIPTMLSNGEWVHPTDAVDYYGPGVMQAMQKRQIPREMFLRRAAGGSVSWPFPVDISKTQIPSGPTDALPPGTPGEGQTPGSWQGLWNIVKSAFPKASLYSAFRKGSRTISGNLSRHALGKAIDVSPFLSIAKLIHSQYGKRTYELISPFSELDLYRGRPHRYSRAVRRQHGAEGAGNAHVHWSTYDGGGYLPPGFTLAYNGTGKNETVRTHDQERNLQQRQGGPVRLDRRDIALLASYISGAQSQVVQMDGRKVAEITNRYTNLPAGV